MYFGTMDQKRQNAREKFRRQVTGRLSFKLFLLLKIPLAFVAGLRVRALDAERCTVSVPYTWRTQNPFRSVYFAAQAMAAEMSTGTLVLRAIQGCSPPVSMLVTKLEAGYSKKASGRVFFTCSDGLAIEEAVERTMANGEGQVVRCVSVGCLADGTEVSRFVIEWSVRRKGGVNRES